MPYISCLHRGVEQLVARRAHNPKVTGSSPVPATKKRLASPSRCKPFAFIGSRLCDLPLRQTHSECASYPGSAFHLDGAIVPLYKFTHEHEP